MVARILQAEGRGRTIIFTRTKRTAAKVADDLAERGFAAAPIHGDLGQGAREQALRAFRNDKVDVLVATDVAARGIDVEAVTHVINFQCPEDEKTYLHRIGRTARAGTTGVAITFVDWDDMPRWGLINKALDLGYPEPEETYSSSPHLYEQLNIPEGVRGTLPKSARTHEGLAGERLEDLGGPESRGGGRGRSRGSAGGRGARGGSDARDAQARREGSGRRREAAPQPAAGGSGEGGGRRRRRTTRVSGSSD
jgi:superfamily II DNA/RNA helicase